jgi:hypothetical protein
MQTGDIEESFFYDPVNTRLGISAAQVRDHRQVVNDIA